MKITNLGALTNFEVLDVLRSRGASSDPLAALGSVSLSECKVFDYLIQTPASVQTREDIDEFMKRCEKYRLLMAEKLHIVNFRPTCPEEIEPFIDEGVKRQEPVDAEELAHMISEGCPLLKIDPKNIARPYNNYS
ncbi:hypothetical protein QJS04_geneDACA011615 [Acorus gramineus]|uniref:DNA-directed RNA polymerase III subunit RPC9 n=1 Tax=Acorus gramineus TaxID=55184 RepID=A0AAV9BV48_ACOGR|nr:hypothetical protein QJS04_geneDACA011615 [Acorus gramineus]